MGAPAPSTNALTLFVPALRMRPLYGKRLGLSAPRLAVDPDFHPDAIRRYRLPEGAG